MSTQNSNLKPLGNTNEEQLPEGDWAELRSRPKSSHKRTNYNYDADVDGLIKSDLTHIVIKVPPGMNSDTLYSGLKSNIAKRHIPGVEVRGFHSKIVLVKTKYLQQQSTEATLTEEVVLPGSPDYPQTSS
jgi:hypothetical protein